MTLPEIRQKIKTLTEATMTKAALLQELENILTELPEEVTANSIKAKIQTLIEDTNDQELGPLLGTLISIFETSDKITIFNTLGKLYREYPAKEDEILEIQNDLRILLETGTQGEISPNAPTRTDVYTALQKVKFDVSDIVLDTLIDSMVNKLEEGEFSEVYNLLGQYAGYSDDFMSLREVQSILGEVIKDEARPDFLETPGDPFEDMPEPSGFSGLLEGETEEVPTFTDDTQELINSMNNISETQMDTFFTAKVSEYISLLSEQGHTAAFNAMGRFSTLVPADLVQKDLMIEQVGHWISSLRNIIIGSPVDIQEVDFLDPFE